MTKVAIGKFYIAIDHNLKEKSSRPDNVYRFIEGVVNSKQEPHELMVYVKDRNIVKDMTSQLEQCTRQLEEVSLKYSELRQQFKTSRDQLKTTKLALRDITNENVHLKRKCQISKRKVET